MNVSTDMATFGWVLSDTARLMRKLADRRLASLGMTRAQWQALVSMQRMGALTQAALADILEVETATVARLIDRLETAGWVERRPDPNDRRVKLISITSKASAIMDEVGVIGRKLREDMLEDIPPHDRERLVGELSTIKSRLIRLLETP
jgi:DNA-binding MarR family transcriptional regulator